MGADNHPTVQVGEATENSEETETEGVELRPNYGVLDA